MNNRTQDNRFVKPMTQATFNCFRQFIQEDLGIKMPDTKKTMLQARLQKRMRALKIQSYDEYRDYVFSIHGREVEMQHMINTVTTNKTDFFREPRHFDFMIDKALPDLINKFSTGMRKPLTVWSAGCSSGEEPYTLAMILSDFSERFDRFHYSIIATDISTKVLQHAVTGIFNEKDVIPVPNEFKKKYLLRSKDRTKKKVRIVPELRSRIAFRQLNFMAERFDLQMGVDIAFCRNVLIYFNRSDQEKIVNRICRHLNPGGYFFVGHSETLGGMDIPLVSAIATVYRKTK